ncbi:MAG: DNA recombination protein RmuC [Actinobacteria bacterium]|nr:DNA recombination protein RmuC [Actinomycetota bacterium]
MEAVTLAAAVAGLVLGGVLAAVVVHLAWSRRAAVDAAGLRERLAAAEAAARTDDQLLDAYRAIAGATLAEQSDQLLHLAATRYQTLETTALGHWQTQGARVVQQLEQQAAQLRELEAQRRAESAVLSTAVSDLRRANDEVRDQARQLAGALRDNAVRGTWGEVQLRRVLEQAGMERHADFVEQGPRSSVGGDGGDRSGRPDVVVRLPDGRSVVIDSKVPLDRYLDAANCDDDDRRTALHAAHAKAVAAHVLALSRRDYHSSVPGSVDLVVMFLPADAFLAAALSARPSLVDEAWSRGIVLASPSTLIGFLRGVALGWREQRIAEQAEEIARTGRELHERLSVFVDHLGKVGSSLGRAVAAYNGAVGSLEARVLPQARRFEDLGAASSRPIDTPATVDAGPRALAAVAVGGGAAADSCDAVPDQAKASSS